MANTKITGEDILLVNALPGDFNFDAESKKAGQTYRRFAYGGKVFISDNPKFYSDLDNGGVHTISLEANDQGQLSMTGYISFKQMQGLKRNQVVLDSITVENYKASAITNPEEIIA